MIKNLLIMQIALFLILASVLHCGLASNSTAYYQPLTPEQAILLSSWTPKDDIPMWVISGQFEGDMVLSPDQRNGAINKNLRWPDRVIPYVLSNDFNNAQKAFIDETLKKEYAKTCIRVVPRTSQQDYVYVTGKNRGCWSKVGRKGGKQQLNLQLKGCLLYGTVVHEFLHAAGFYHQQSATERDDWVTICWKNILRKHKHNFNKLPATVITSFDEKYDYGSLMHYPRKAFSNNRRDTIVPKVAGAQIGQNKGLSAIDIKKLNKMYGCA